MPSLYDEWLTDQALGFSANWLIAAENGSGDSRLFLSACKMVAEQTNFLHGMSLPTLSLLAAIPPDANVIKDSKSTLYDISAQTASARNLLEGLTVSDASSTPLSINAALILQRDHLSFEDFLKWACRATARASPKTPYSWSRGLWARILGNLEDNPKLVIVEEFLRVYREKKTALPDRIEAINQLYQTVNTAASLDPDTPFIQPWKRLAKNMLGELFCWPLMVSADGNNLTAGISLPLAIHLIRDGKSEVRIVAGEMSENKFLGDASSPTLFGFEVGALRWNKEWRAAFSVGLSTAKTLWSTQNGRLASKEMKDAQRACSMLVDLSHANAIASRLYTQSDVDATYRLWGGSAEAYLTQVALSQMLRDGSKPDGVATGRVRYEDGFFRLIPVEGIGQKLKYANDSGMFSRIVLPEDEKIKKEVDEHIRELEQARMVEINYCPSARSAADAMQASGWRRAHFFRTPAAQRAFYGQLFRLFRDDNPQGSIGQYEKAIDYISEEDRVDLLAKPTLTAYDQKKFTKLSAFLTNEKYAVKYCKRSDINLTEELLGRWLAWVDHQVRQGFGSEPGPGLGVLCVRTSERDNEMRFWSALFDILKANDDQWEKFRWADLEGAAAILAGIFNNFGGKAAVSNSPPPDLIILIDDAGFTQHPTNNVFREDFRGQLFDLLNPQLSSRPYHFANALDSLDASRTGPLGKTRLVIIYDDVTKQAPNLEVPIVDDRLRKLAIFRQSFAVQSVVSVLHHDSLPAIGKEQARQRWEDVRNLLEKWKEAGHLYRHRGQYHMNRKLRRELQILAGYDKDPALHFAAARALAPIIDPRALFLAANRDRAMEPEQLAEATWHLLEARANTEQKDKRWRPRINEALAMLTFLRPDADWDTINTLNSLGRYDESYDLAIDLLDAEQNQGFAPHSSRYALAIKTIGRHAKRIINSPEAHENLLKEAQSFYTKALESANASPTEHIQQRIKLDSEYAYCLRNNLQNNYSGISAELQSLESNLESLLSQLLRQKALVGIKAPVSRDWLALRWEDERLSKVERAKFARYACELCEGTNDYPWLAQLALMSTDFETPQLAGVLNSWKHSYDDKNAFFTRLSGLSANMLRELPSIASWNLLTFLTRADNPLQGPPADCARQWIIALAKIVPPYAGIDKADKQLRNTFIWNLCSLLGNGTRNPGAVHPDLNNIAPPLLTAAGIDDAWLFILATAPVHADTLLALTILLRNIPNDRLQSAQGQESIQWAIKGAIKNLRKWEKNNSLRNGDLRRLKSVAAALGA